MTGALSLSFFTNPHESQATQHSIKAIYTTTFHILLKKFGNDHQKGEPTDRALKSSQSRVRKIPFGIRLQIFQLREIILITIIKQIFLRNVMNCIQIKL